MNEKEKNVSSRIEDYSSLIIADEVFPDHLQILPMVNRPMFPGMMIPIIIQGEEFVEIINNAFNTEHRLVGAVFIKELDKNNILDSELYEFGTVIKIHRIVQIDDATVQLLVQGLKRFEKKGKNGTENKLIWNVIYHDDPVDDKSEELRAYTLEIISTLKELLKLNSLFQEQLKMLMSHFSTEKPGRIMDIIASMTTAESVKLQDLLETTDLIKRANKLLVILREEIELSKLQEKIKKNIDEKISKQQKKFFLQEQLKIIKQELGLEKDDKSAEIEKFLDRIKKLTIPDEVKKVIDMEIGKMKMIEPSSSEYHVIRTYLDWLTELPWGVYTKDRMDIRRAKKILNESHYGLDDLKKRILEFISTAKIKGKLSGSILCFVGPPGVGKTSIGKSVADAINRKFYRFSVGGMKDEAEIKGHRRTYIGAMPGKFIQLLKRVSSSNPVVMLDEIDKIGSSYRGDPASALLEVLDPEQNKDFLDHYLDVRFDLSNILFITTANQLDTIPPALFDRMEIMKLPGYILQEKINIAKKFLIPRQFEVHGLTDNDLEIEDDALKIIIDKYAREAGVRNLENNLKKIMRNITYKIATGKKGKVTLKDKNVEEYLGKPIFPGEELYNKDVPGVTLGLAWTRMGGTTLYIEATGIKSKGSGFKQTGQLGKVMKESSEIAYSYIRSNLCNKEEYKCYFDENFIHLHVPAGATPKDGPSAGITMALALYSLATNNPVRNDIAMTGELTLTGKILPIGGVKEKIIAARRVGIMEIILPKDNQRDFDVLPTYIKKGIKVHFLDYFDEVIKVIYKKKKKKKK